MPERGFAGAIGLGHGFEINLGMIDRTGPASAINLPPPWLWRAGAVLDDDGKIGVLNHGQIILEKFRPEHIIRK